MPLPEGMSRLLRTGSHCEVHDAARMQVSGHIYLVLTSGHRGSHRVASISQQIIFDLLPAVIRPSFIEHPVAVRIALGW